MPSDPRVAIVKKKRSKTVHFCWIYEGSHVVSICGLLSEKLGDESESVVKEVETFANFESACKSCAAKKNTPLWECCSLYGKHPRIEEEFFRHIQD